MKLIIHTSLFGLRYLNESDVWSQVSYSFLFITWFPFIPRFPFIHQYGSVLL